MVKVFKKFGGAILLYVVVFFGIVAISSRLNHLHETDFKQMDGVIAINQ